MAISLRQRIEICDHICCHKRQRDMMAASHIQIENRLASITAVAIGYHSFMGDKDRKDHWSACEGIIKGLCKDIKRTLRANKKLRQAENGEALMALVLTSKTAGGGENRDHYLASIASARVGHEYPYPLMTDEDTLDCIAQSVLSAYSSIVGYKGIKKTHEKLMGDLVEQLPVWEWAKQFSGIAQTSVGNIIGVAGGDLSKYPNPGKLWKRFGCAPFEKDGHMHMGSTWNVPNWRDKVIGKDGKLKPIDGLSGDDWTAYGYVPKRRSAAHMLATSIILQTRSGDGNPYRQRYDEAKKRAAKLHPDWTPMHVSKHGNLLCAKRFIRDIWCEWNGKPIWDAETARKRAQAAITRQRLGVSQASVSQNGNGRAKANGKAKSNGRAKQKVKV